MKKTSKSNKPKRVKKGASKNINNSYIFKIKSVWQNTKHWIINRKWWQKILLGILALIILILTVMYSIFFWHQQKYKDEPLQLGISFSINYARSMNLEPKETLEAMLTDLKPDRVRLVSYWSEHEKQRGVYDFSELDWQLEMLEKHGAKASLALGLRQPRWPECHFPQWTNEMNEKQIEQPLLEYITQTVNRYKDHPALGEYQLENEYFLKVFGECRGFHSRDRLVKEYELVKELDPSRRVIVTRSNNALGWPVYAPIPDASGVSVYKRVWDKTITKRYFEYPFPGWFYGFLAGVTEIMHDKPMIIHELQAEPWPPSGSIIENSLEEQDKSMDAKRLKSRAKYGISSGIKTIDFWGGEWWYWRLKHANDPSVWEAGKQIFEEYRR